MEPLTAINELHETIKKISMNTTDWSNPVDVKVGLVKSISPLKIQLNQRLALTKSFLKVSKELTDYETEITINGKREKAIIHNSLKVGEYVYLIRYEKGQKFLVIGRVSQHV